MRESKIELSPFRKNTAYSGSPTLMSHRKQLKSFEKSKNQALLQGKTKNYDDFKTLKILIDSWKALKGRSNKSDIDKKLIMILGEEFAQTFDFDDNLMCDLEALCVPNEKTETMIKSKIEQKLVKRPLTDEGENLDEMAEKRKVKSTKFIKVMNDE